MIHPLYACAMGLAALILAPDPDGSSDSPRIVRWVLATKNPVQSDASLVEQWQKRAATAQSEFEEFDVRLTAANWLLSRRISAPVSRILLGIESEDDKKVIEDALDAAKDEIKKAEDLWAKIVKSDELPNAHDSKRAKDLIGIGIFFDVFNSLWAEDNSSKETRDESLREAANRLSLLLIEDRKDIVAAAQLWQGYAYTQRGRLKGALELWPRTLVHVKPPHGVSLYARLMQCKTLVEKDQTYAAGVTLLLNLEQNVGYSIADGKKSAEAQGAVAFVRRQFVRAWRKKLMDEGELDRATWLSQMIETLDVSHDPGDGVVQMLAMEFAAPEFVDLDKTIARLNEPPKRERADSNEVTSNVSEDAPTDTDENEDANSEGEDVRPADPGE